MNPKLFVGDLKNTPFRFLPGKLFSLFYYKFLKLFLNISDKQPSMLLISDQKSDFKTFLELNELKVSKKEIELNMAISDQIISKEIEILGSGWVNIGIENFDSKSQTLGLNSKVAKKSHNSSKNHLLDTIRSFNPSYEFVNWHKDVLSNYNFPKDQHFSKIQTIIDIEGVDVKNVWEIGRMHHLTLLLPLMISPEADISDNAINEIKCEILDFILNNPVRWGIHWTSAMEVSIRLLNLTVIRNLIPIDNDKENNFLNILDQCIKEHIDFAWRFREHKNGLANNHYLANLVGLMFGSFAFRDNNKYALIFKKCCNRFWKELDKQFLIDGGNFESSTCYHVFSSEIAALGLAMCFRADKDDVLRFNDQTNEDIKQKVLVKIYKALMLFKSIILENGEIPQFGDNDSARMFFMTYVPEEDEKSEFNRNLLNYESSLDIISTIFNEHSKRSIHTDLISSLMKGGSYKNIDENKLDFVSRSYKIKSLKHKISTVYTVSENFKGNLKEGLAYTAYPEFGIYLFKSQNLYLLINGMNRHVKQYWPHGHNDKLSFELWINGRPLVRDPGSYTYTGNPSERNKYRSINAHSTAVFDNEEQNLWLAGMSGVFRMIPRTKVELLLEEKDRVVLRLNYSKFEQVREFIIGEKEVHVNDQGNYSFKVNEYPIIPMSFGYGKLKKF